MYKKETNQIVKKNVGKKIVNKKKLFKRRALHLT